MNSHDITYHIYITAFDIIKSFVLVSNLPCVIYLPNDETWFEKHREILIPNISFIDQEYIWGLVHSSWINEPCQLTKSVNSNFVF